MINRTPDFFTIFDEILDDLLERNHLTSDPFSLANQTLARPEPTLVVDAPRRLFDTALELPPNGLIGRGLPSRRPA